MLIFFTYLILVLTLSVIDFGKNKNDVFLRASLFFSLFIVFITECLSYFKSLNFLSIACCWAFFSAFMLFYLIKNKKKTLIIIGEYKDFYLRLLPKLSLGDKILITIILTGLSLLFFQGLIYPPNNWDSLTYHMSRIMYWLGNESVEHFQSHILRHLYQPPFAEYFILNVNVINGNDYFSNSVQLFFLVLSLFSFWGVLRYFNVSRLHKLIGILLLITIPAVELQSSTTKNDIVTGFFVITTVYFSLKSYYEITLRNFILLGISVGLAMLTKGTSYIFLTPILLLFIILMVVRIKDLGKIIKFGFFSVVIVLLVNIGHFSRNFKINGDILNIDKLEAKNYSNAEINAELITSNFLKNLGLHIPYPFQPHYDLWIREWHDNNNIDINNPDSNYLSIPYQGVSDNQTNEDAVPNGLHILIIFISLLIVFLHSIFKPQKNKKELLLILVISLQVILFVGYLKWQPWHTRLHIPIFMFSVLLVSIAIKKIKFFYYTIIIAMPLLIYSFYFNFVYNNTRPIITNTRYTKNIKVDDIRFKKYFSNQLQLYPEYVTTLNLLYDSNPKIVGLLMNDWEYPLFNAYYYEKIELKAVLVNNITNKIIQNKKNVDLIISTKNSEYIFYDDKKYMNKTQLHKHIWVYKIN